MIESRLAGYIDRTSSLPYYAQLKEALKRQIEAGAWAPGDLLPSEAELCESFSVSRTVVRQALQELEQEGFIYRRRGKGSFVAEPKVHETLVQKLTGFHQDMVEQGHVVVNQVLKQEVIAASADVARALDIAVDTPVIVCERLRYIDGKPVNVSISYIPYARCQPLLVADLRNQSLYAIIERISGQRIVRGKRVIEAIMPPTYIAGLLGAEEDLPLFKLNTICYLADETPIEHSIGYHRSDRSRFDVELIRHTPDDGALEQAQVIEPKTLPQSFTLLDK